MADRPPDGDLPRSMTTTSSFDRKMADFDQDSDSSRMDTSVSRKRKDDSSKTRKKEEEKKKKRVAPVSSDEEYDNPQMNNTAQKILPPAELLSHCNTLGNEVSGKNLQTLKKKISEVYKYCKQLMAENTGLKEKLAESNNITAQLSQLTTTITGALGEMTQHKCTGHKPEATYAQKVRVQSKIVPQKAVKPPKHIVTVFPQEESDIKSSDDTKSVIYSNVIPTKDKLKIRNVRKINNNGILVETETAQDLENVLKNEKLQSAGLKVGLPIKKRPKMIIYSVPRELEEKEIIAAIHQQNLEEVPEAKLNSELRLMFKTGQKDKDTVNWVIEAAPEIRELLKKNSRIYIGWTACYIQDYVSISRCYKCQSFGHIAKYCKAEENTCVHCAMDGHAFNNCPVKANRPLCVNCKRANKPCDHSSRDKHNPAYKNAIEAHISKIDYGL